MVEAPSALSSSWRSGWMRERPERWRERRGKRRKWQRMSFSFIKHPETCSSVDVLTDFIDTLLIFFSKMEVMQMFACKRKRLEKN